jgi:hypothetical protein
MALRWMIGAAAALCVGTAAAQPAKVREGEPPVWRQLERFSGEAEFLQYVRTLRGAERGRYDVEEDSIVVTGSAIPPPPPPPPPPAAPPPPSVNAPTTQAQAAEPSPGAAESTLADAAAPDGTSITNVQTQGVDEGGIVKQVGRFLVVLQDGRLFVIDTRPGGVAGLSLTARQNVYRQPNADTWYDEMLISGNRILVTGYSYRESASEITIFNISEAGALTRETTYYISSNDYYDTENYATRLVGSNLVIYTPLDLQRVDPDRPVRWPLVRRWLRDGEHRAITSRGRPLFDARAIYKPIQRTFGPIVHSVSVCPLGGSLAGDELECRTTAFVGASQREFFVSNDDIYLWVTPDWRDGIASNCSLNAGPDASALPATIYQVPLNGTAPRALHARGQPMSQLALDASETEFRALVSWNTAPCSNARNAEVRYFHAPLSSFSTTPTQAPQRAFVVAPSPNAPIYETRFTSTHVVYGGRESQSSYPPAEGEQTNPARIVAIPVTRPSSATVLEAPHNVLRVERAGSDIVLSGYANDNGLTLSVLSLTGRPRFVGRATLAGRYESENRSHAFNALVAPEGNGLMGLPTVTRIKESGRWYFRSGASDVSFLSIDRGRLQSLGALLASPDARHPSYACEVSCVDWYGNTRALFTGGRIFALSATELIEGGLGGGGIGEVRRINLSAPPPR